MVLFSKWATSQSTAAFLDDLQLEDENKSIFDQLWFIHKQKFREKSSRTIDINCKAFNSEERMKLEISFLVG